MEAEARKRLEDEVAKVAPQVKIIMALADTYDMKQSAVYIKVLTELLTDLNEDLKALADRMRAPTAPFLPWPIG